MDEIHGVNDIIEETPTLVQSKLEEFRHELEEYIQDLTPYAAIRVAIELNRDYVYNPRFLLAFLRSEQYDILPSIKRIVNFFEQKRQIFGEQSLGRDITVTQDFDEDDRKLLESGYAYLLPGKDRSGRAIAFSFSHLRRQHSVKSVVSIFGILVCRPPTRLMPMSSHHPSSLGPPLVLHGNGRH